MEDIMARKLQDLSYDELVKMLSDILLEDPEAFHTLRMKIEEYNW